VPAAFDVPECNATQRAAKLAGLTTAPLLQEPVAAALAYGFQSVSDKVFWLVYDFGGGTFDAAVIQLRDGLIQVVNHAGDNQLGGKLIDWALIERVFVPKLLAQHRLPDFRRGADRWRGAFAKLKSAAEEAKIQVSRTQKPFNVYKEAICQDDKGEAIDFECTLSPAELASIAEPFIRRSLDLSKRAISDKGVPLSAIERVILVGGTSLLPSAREAIQSELKAQIDLTVNPLEAVARGAAAFAGTQRSEGHSPSTATAGVIQLELICDPVGGSVDFPVGGRFRNPSGKSLSGFTVQISETKSRWRTGRIALDQNGSFLTEAHAERGRRCEFVVELFDSQGTRVPTEPSGFAYTVGMVIAGAPLTHNIGVAMANNKVDWFFKKGQSLPARARRVHRAAQGLKKGAAGAILRIPFVEGEHEHRADRNQLIGYLEIAATDADVRRDVPMGAEVEITLEIDDSRVIRARAEVPMIEMEVERVLNEDAYQARSAKDLQADLQREVARMSELAAQARHAATSSALPVQTLAEADSLVHRIEELSTSAQGDVDAAKEAEKSLRELKGKLDIGEQTLAWPAAVKESQECLEDTRKLVAQGGGSIERQLLADTERRLTESLGTRDLDLLRDAIEELRSLGFRVLDGRIEFWAGHLTYLESRRAIMLDAAIADRLFAQGKRALEAKDITALRATVRQLFPLLPPDEQEKAEAKGFGGGTQK
jgi:molecular chaperone DnaK